MSSPIPSDTLSPILTRSPDDLQSRFAALHRGTDVADLLEIDDKYLRQILYRRHEPDNYRCFTIPKRRGGVRQICAPPPALSILQSKMNRILQIVYHPKTPVHGFVSGRSILTNALNHLGRRWVLNIDLEDFFPSINFGRVRGMFMARPYSIGERAATVLAQICCSDNQLPQGAPTSPVVSNMVCGRLDGQLLHLARKYRCTYTRYGDDITLSSRAFHFPDTLAVTHGAWVGRNVTVGENLRTVIVKNGFRVNEQKTRLQFRDCHQEVTGITVNKFPNVPRAYVRELRAMIHAWRRYGLEAAEQVYHERYQYRARSPRAERPRFRAVVRGKLEFLRMVRGEADHVYRKLRNQLHAVDPTVIDAVAVTHPTAPMGDDARPAADLTWQHWFDKYKDLVYLVEICNTKGDHFAGTAFSFLPGRLATAAHNLIGDLTVHSTDGTVLPIKEVILHPRYAEGVDCGTITLAGTVSGPAHLPVGEKLPLPGEAVAILGYATVPQRRLGLGVYAGHVETILTDYGGHVDYIHISSVASGGLSGSPVINRAGEVLGVVIESTFEAVAEGLPARQFCSVLPVGYLRDLSNQPC